MTDNRTNEPTEAMILAGLNRVDWDAIRAGEADPREAAAHAIWHALQAAAQGAAPDGQVIIPIARIRELRAAKDAALAAIERCRALVAEWKHEGPSGPFPDRIAIDVGVEVIEPLLAALDGAPEPEVKP